MQRHEGHIVNMRPPSQRKERHMLQAVPCMQLGPECIVAAAPQADHFLKMASRRGFMVRVRVPSSTLRRVTRAVGRQGEPD